MLQYSRLFNASVRRLLCGYPSEFLAARIHALHTLHIPRTSERVLCNKNKRPRADLTMLSRPSSLVVGVAVAQRVEPSQPRLQDAKSQLGRESKAHITCSAAWQAPSANCKAKAATAILVGGSPTRLTFQHFSKSDNIAMASFLFLSIPFLCTPLCTRLLPISRPHNPLAHLTSVARVGLSSGKCLPVNLSTCTGCAGNAQEYSVNIN